VIKPDEPLEGVLTPSQEAALKELQEVDAGAQVVGWSSEHSGPVVIFTDGNRRVIGPTGKLVPTRQQP
jgi:hypothetical protein